jgi:carbamoyl-phosphate synthase small subunit
VEREVAAQDLSGVTSAEMTMKVGAKKKAMLALEDGSVFRGWACGAEREVEGEVVFNTSMTGYQEILTDPSYRGQIVTMTYPLIGNYGVNREDVESGCPQVAGFLVKELCRTPSNWRSTQTLESYLKEHDIPAVEGIDTRALTKKIRTRGDMRAAISSRVQDPDELVDMARHWPGLVGLDMVSRVTCGHPYSWPPDDRVSATWERRPPPGTRAPESGFCVVALDFGMKRNIGRILHSCGCDLTVVPASTPAEDILARKPDGVFLSNGPGDPAGVTYAIDTVKKLLGKKPIFGICLGHQILGLALGGRTYKMKFGHRGANQPVMETDSGRVFITSQNHGYCVDASTLDPQRVKISHVNLNDQTPEGMEIESLGAFSVQHHPEASPGPHDHMRALFEKFLETMRQHA